MAAVFSYINNHIEEISSICNKCKNRKEFPECWKTNTCVNERVKEIKHKYDEKQRELIIGGK